jgi:carbon monoxide dehydrogenase subunit G
LFQEVARTVRVAAPADRAWSVLLDFPRVASWLRVVRDLRELEPMRKYTTVLEDRVGPFAMRADLAIDVTADTAAKTLRVSGAGEDRQIASRISAALDLAVSPQGDASDVVVTGRYEITGRIATLGAGAIRKKGDKVLEDFFGNLVRELSAAGERD